MEEEIEECRPMHVISRIASGENAVTFL